MWLALHVNQRLRAIRASAITALWPHERGTAIRACGNVHDPADFIVDEPYEDVLAMLKQAARDETKQQAAAHVAEVLAALSHLAPLSVYAPLQWPAPKEPGTLLPSYGENCV